MALKKPIELPSGVVAEYWRIVEFHHNVRDGSTRVLLQLYLNEDARRSGKEPMPIYEQIFFTKEDNPLADNNEDYIQVMLAKLYTHIKNVAALSVEHKNQGLEHMRVGSERVLEKFADAEDV